MPNLFHLHSRYARLTVQAIDFCLEHVCAADEVLFGQQGLDARDMIRVARTVLETELLLERDPVGFVGPSSEPRSDWTLACLAESFAQAAVQLRERGARSAAQRVLTDQRDALQRIVESPLRSPLVNYQAVLSALMYDLPPSSRGELLELQRRAISEALASELTTNVQSLLCEMAECHLQLGQVELALTMYLALVRFDPTNISIHNQLAIALSRRFAALAHAAATRALLLMPRDDNHALRPQLRAIIAETGRARATLPEGAARVLLGELQTQPGKRSRASLRTLCLEIAPEIGWLTAKEPEPLPASSALAQLRRDLQRLPRPLRSAASVGEPGAAQLQPQPVDRSAPGLCGSDKACERCCGAD
jgi:tetratricopeptide (TPR) repeat protein